MKNDRFHPPSVKPGMELYGRKVLLGVCGGIAAYKAVELTRQLVKAGARVQVVMTEAATKFVAPLTFETITARHVFVEMFPQQGEFSPWHTEIATWADIAVVAPATANHLARLAAGLADDLLSTLMLTLERPRVLCPAMNPRMWANVATQENLSTLKKRGYRVIMPEEGQMARPGEDDGVGRLSEPDVIFRELSHVLSAPQDMRGVRVLVTAGRTEEFWDPVRMLTNRSTGRMGFALAEEARERGADVVLIHGPTDVIPPTGVRIHKITTAQEMAQAVKAEFPQSNIVLMSAAVADYTFPDSVRHKIKKGDPQPEVHLVPTEDILKSLSQNKGNRIIVGFALETENLLENALKKLREKHLDLVVANNPLVEGAGFAGETNQVLLIHRSGRVVDLPLQSKREIAREILNAVIETYRHPEPEQEEIEKQFEEEQAERFPEYDVGDEPEAEMARPEMAVAPGASAHPRKKKHGRPEKRHSGGKPEQPPAPPPVAAIVAKPPEIVPVAVPIEPSAPAEVVVSPAAAPIPNPKKSGRTRRGGRRAKARAARIAARMAEQQGASPAPATQDTPVTGAAFPPGRPAMKARPPEPMLAPEPIPQLNLEPMPPALPMTSVGSGINGDKPRPKKKPMIKKPPRPVVEGKKSPPKKPMKKPAAKEKVTAADK
jgi:phosphopantothenoylcysteine decarboxylase/phosphopantothenate--cysteine ligase